MTTGTDRDELIVFVAEDIVHAEWLRVISGHDAIGSDAADQSNPVTPAPPPTVGMRWDGNGGLVALAPDHDAQRHPSALAMPRAMATQRSPPRAPALDAEDVVVQRR